MPGLGAVIGACCCPGCAWKGLAVGWFCGPMPGGTTWGCSTGSSSSAIGTGICCMVAGGRPNWVGGVVLAMPTGPRLTGRIMTFSN